MTDSTSFSSSSILRVALVSSFLWSLTLGSLLYWSIANEIKQSSDIAQSQTRAFFLEFLMARLWNTFHGGVYVPVSEATPPNPYLKDDPYRDLVTTSGINLTKLNPAYMTRQISKLSQERTQVVAHLTGLKPINQQNAPDLWEKKALQQTGNDTEYFELITTKNGAKMFRYMSPLIIEPECLNCHEKYGGIEGIKNGGISISIPAQPIIDSQNNQIKRFLLSYFTIWFIGIISIWSCSFRMSRHYRERSGIIHQLEQSLKEVKKLSGMLPICCSCKKIRDDKGYWNQVEKYISDHAEIKFSHGICPDCAKKLYPEFCE